MLQEDEASTGTPGEEGRQAGAKTPGEAEQRKCGRGNQSFRLQHGKYPLVSMNNNRQLLDLPMRLSFLRHLKSPENPDHEYTDLRAGHCLRCTGWAARLDSVVHD
ncbi:hypothetical protein NDU88_000594 [Pleurodeles waltl]|uniref:Uncharacterized protein n=1 Tax=Pleurodeles waltl TaxID=8319 RepID=A0AAV7V5I1_PLEWA|nr:hypothetical protein NDU88_000594 [Pleurodeles waltl]